LCEDVWRWDWHFAFPHVFTGQCLNLLQQSQQKQDIYIYR
jgi:hypothetical protein